MYLPRIFSLFFAQKGNVGKSYVLILRGLVDCRTGETPDVFGELPSFPSSRIVTLSVWVGSYFRVSISSITGGLRHTDNQVSQSDIFRVQYFVDSAKYCIRGLRYIGFFRSF